MGLNEFLVFVSLICNFDQPSSVVPRIYKEECAIFWTNCAVVDDKSVDRRKLSACLEKMKSEAPKWR